VWAPTRHTPKITPKATKDSSTFAVHQPCRGMDYVWVPTRRKPKNTAPLRGRCNNSCKFLHSHLPCRGMGRVFLQPSRPKKPNPSEVGAKSLQFLLNDHKVIKTIQVKRSTCRT
jgi:hypothetical protein